MLGANTSVVSLRCRDRLVPSGGMDERVSHHFNSGTMAVSAVPAILSSGARFGRICRVRVDAH